MPVRSTAPVRICDIGGWTDTRFAGSGAVTNLAVNLLAHIYVSELPTSPGQPPRVEIDALDAGAQVEIADAGRVEYDGTLDLLKAAVVRMGISRSLRVAVWSDAPPGSGMGTSSATAVALLAALGRTMGRNLPRHRLAQLAHALEVEELGIECGVQDQYAAAFGGASFMEVQYPDVLLSRLPLSRRFVEELNERLLTVYTGESRLSHNIHGEVIRTLAEAPSSGSAALQELQLCAYRMRDALLGEDLGGLAQAMNANWEAQKALCSAVTTPRIEETIEVARIAGATGAKANGAGGGGTVTLLCAAGTEPLVRRALAGLDGRSLLPCRLSDTGVRAWDVP